MKIFISYSINSIAYPEDKMKSGFSNCAMGTDKKIKNFDELLDIQKDIQEKLKKIEKLSYCQVVIISFQYLED